MYSTKLTGVSKALQMLDKLNENQQNGLAKVIVEVAEEIMTDSKENYVPVDTGTLRDSGHVEEPEISEKVVAVTLGFGGQGISYAVTQHEDLGHVHTIGQAKYLEIPFRMRIRMLGKRMKEAIFKGLK